MTGDDPYSMIIARLRLAKVPLCLLIGSAALFGGILADPAFSLRTLLVAWGIFLAATGGASLNSLQEQTLDSLMERTKGRPLPSGLLTAKEAGWQAGFLILAGLLVLALKTADFLPTVLTALALLLYNGVYTPLKTRTVWALVPGTLCGALPVLIGWLAGRGEWLSFTFFLLLTLFVLWQVPHFWLILLNYKDDYAMGKIPNHLTQFYENALLRLMIPWIGALTLVMLMFVILPYPLVDAAKFAGICNALCLPGMFYLWFKRRKGKDYRKLFIILNGSLLLHMIIFAVGRLVGHMS